MRADHEEIFLDLAFEAFSELLFSNIHYRVAAMQLILFAKL